MSRNGDKGREAENAVASFMAEHGFPHAERRPKRGGHALMTCVSCYGSGLYPNEVAGVGTEWLGCPDCEGRGCAWLHRDAGDLTGIPGVVVQVKWSPYEPLADMLARTEEQRRVAYADIGVLVVKRKGVGLARAGEWDTYLPLWAVMDMLDAPFNTVWAASLWDTTRVSLNTACALLRPAYGTLPGVSV